MKVREGYLIRRQITGVDGQLTYVYIKVNRINENDTIDAKYSTEVSDMSLMTLHIASVTLTHLIKLTPENDVYELVRVKRVGYGKNMKEFVKVIEKENV